MILQKWMINKHFLLLSMLKMVVLPNISLESAIHFFDEIESSKEQHLFKILIFVAIFVTC